MPQITVGVMGSAKLMISDSDRQFLKIKTCSKGFHATYSVLYYSERLFLREL